MLITSNGPVKNAVEAQNFLEQCALIATGNNFTFKTLANILFNLALKGKIPDHYTSIIKAVSFLLLNKAINSMSKKLATTFLDKSLTIYQPLINELEREHNLIKAMAAEQTRHTLNLTNTIEKLTKISHKLETFATIKPQVQTLAESTKTLFTITKKLKNIPPLLTHPSSSSNQQSNPNATTYANVTSTPPRTNGPLPHLHNPNQPEHIQCITN